MCVCTAVSSGKLEDLVRAVQEAKEAGFTESNPVFKDALTNEKELTEKCRVCNNQCVVM